MKTVFPPGGVFGGRFSPGGGGGLGDSMRKER